MSEQQNIENKSSIHNFDEYVRQGEPDKKEKGLIWQTAIGLQAIRYKILGKSGIAAAISSNRSL